MYETGALTIHLCNNVNDITLFKYQVKNRYLISDLFNVRQRRYRLKREQPSLVDDRGVRRGPGLCRVENQRGVR